MLEELHGGVNLGRVTHQSGNTGPEACDSRTICNTRLFKSDTKVMSQLVYVGAMVMGGGGSSKPEENRIASPEARGGRSTERCEHASSPFLLLASLNSPQEPSLAGVVPF